MDNKEQILVSEFHKTSTELIRVHLSEFKNKLYCNIRVWVADEPQEWRPSYKGITISTDLLGKLYDAVGRAIEEANTRSGASSGAREG